MIGSYVCYVLGSAPSWNPALASLYISPTSRNSLSTISIFTANQAGLAHWWSGLFSPFAPLPLQTEGLTSSYQSRKLLLSLNQLLSTVDFLFWSCYLRLLSPVSRNEKSPSLFLFSSTLLQTKLSFWAIVSLRFERLLLFRQSVEFSLRRIRLGEVFQNPWDHYTRSHCHMDSRIRQRRVVRSKKLSFCLCYARGHCKLT